MRTWLRNRWIALRTSYWLVPTCFAAASVGLAYGLLEADARFDPPRFFGPGPLYQGGPEGARELLGTLAGAMLATAGTAFSVTIVALSLASQQFGPRLLRSFLRDPGNQVVLGTFVATFLYCLLVLRAVPAGDAPASVPVLSLTAAVILGALGLGVLIYFFHHVASMVQASHVASLVARDLDRSVRRHGSGGGDDEREAATARALRERFAGAPHVLAERSGYVQAIDVDTVAEVADRLDAVVVVLRRAGHFVIAGTPLLRIGPRERGRAPSAPPGAEAARLRRAFLIGRERTEDQDVEFSVRQLVEVALRALSPSLEDPYTAINCIDWLAAALGRLACEGPPSRLRTGAEGRVRVVLDGPDFAGVASVAFDPIRRAAAGHPAVSIRLLEAIADLAPCLRTRAQAEALRVHADRVREASLAAAGVGDDRAALAAHHAAAVRALEAHAAQRHVDGSERSLLAGP